jgi:hypothetical protein
MIVKPITWYGKLVLSRKHDSNIRSDRLTRGAGLRLSRIDHASFTFFFIWRWLSGPRVYLSLNRELLGVAGSCAVAGWATSGPNTTRPCVLPPPIARRSCQLLLIAIFLACRLERRDYLCKLDNLHLLEAAFFIKSDSSIR